MTSRFSTVNRPDITIFIHSVGGGGAERIAVTLCNSFIEKGKRVDLIVMNKGGAYWSMISPKAEVFDFDSNKMLKTIVPLMRYLSIRRPSTLLCFLPAANVVGVVANLLALRPSRVVLSERCVFSLVAKTKSGFQKPIYCALPLLYHLAAHIICVSQGVADDLKQFVSLPLHKISVIYNPTIREELYTLKEAPVDHPWLAPGQQPVLLAVGAFRPEKNYDLLLRAFSNIDQNTNARLLILGEGPDRATLEQLVRDLGITDRVDMPGFKSNPYAYMAKATAFIMCSTTEGLPNALIEALACGCPVIATDCPGGMREILGNQQYGLLVPEGNQAELTAAINTTLNNLSQARERVAAFHREQLYKFTPETSIPQYMDVLGL